MTSTGGEAAAVGSRGSGPDRNSTSGAVKWKLWPRQRNTTDTNVGQPLAVPSSEERGAFMDRPGRTLTRSERPTLQRSLSSTRANTIKPQSKERDWTLDNQMPLIRLSTDEMKPSEQPNVNDGSQAVLKPFIVNKTKPSKRISRKPSRPNTMQLTSEIMAGRDEENTTFPLYNPDMDQRMNTQQSDKDTVARLKQMMEALERSYASRIEDLERSHAEFVRRLQDDHMSQRSADQRQHKKEISYFTAEVDSVNTRARQEKEEFKAVLEGMQTSFKTASAKQLQDHTSERSQLIRAHENEISRLTKTMQDMDIDAKRRLSALEAERAASKEEHRVHNLKQSDIHQAEISALSQNHSDNVSRLRDAAKRQGEKHQVEVSELSRKHSENLSQLQDAAKKQLSDALKSHHEATTELQERHAEEVSQLNQASEQRLKEQEEEHQEALLERSQEIEHWKSSHDQELENARHQHVAEISQLTQTFEANGKQAMSVFDREKYRLQAEIKELNAALSEADQETLGSLLSAPPAKTDDSLKNDFFKLQRAVEEIGWLEWKKNDEINTLLENVEGEVSPRQLKRAVLQHIIWGQLFHHVFTSPFRVFGQQGQILEKEWAAFCGEAESTSDQEYAWPSLTHRNERWRSMTIAGCREVLKSRLSQYDPRVQLKKGFSESLDMLASTLKTKLGDVIDLDSEEHATKLIEKLPRKAAATWIDFAAQRCRIMIRPDSTSTSTLGVAALLESSSVLSTRPELGRYGDVDGTGLDIFTTIQGCAGQTMETGGE